MFNSIIHVLLVILAVFLIACVFTSIAMLIGIAVVLHVDKKRQAQIQREWDEYSKDMTADEKKQIAYKWSCDKSREHGWRDVYMPHLIL